MLKSKIKRNAKAMFAFLMGLFLLTNMFAFPVFADDELPEDYVLIEDDDESYDEALSVLSLSKEEAEECNVYSINVTPVPYGVSIPDNSGYYYFPEFTFYDSNMGAYWTNNGNQLKWGFTWYGTYGYNEAKYVRVDLVMYPSVAVNNSSFCYREAGYTSDWISAIKGVDYRFVYMSGITGDNTTVPYATIKMFVATRTV